VREKTGNVEFSYFLIFITKIEEIFFQSKKCGEKNKIIYKLLKNEKTRVFFEKN